MALDDVWRFGKMEDGGRKMALSAGRYRCSVDFPITVDKLRLDIGARKGSEANGGRLGVGRVF